MNAFDYWRDLQLTSRDRAERLDPSIERARWRALAGAYDRNAVHTSAPEFAWSVADRVQTGESVLEIGPGTGGFTLPVAERASRVLAVDLSEAMLGMLRDRLDDRGVRNVEMRQGEWPEVEVAPHDVVLAVNSLYRVLDVRACIERMTAAAGRCVIVGWSVGHNPPVLPSVVDPAGPRRYRPGVTYIHLLLALHELGIAAELDVYRVPRLVWRASYDDAAEKLLGVPDPTDEERQQATDLARQWFVPDGDGVVHRYEGRVAVVVWQGQGE